MRYFDNFPLIAYNLNLNDPTANNTFFVKNIFERVQMLSSVITNINTYYQYSMQEGDTFESIAYKYYGDANRYWIILFTNQILDPFYDAPLKYQQFLDFINNKYGSLANSQSIIDHYELQITKTIQNSSLGIYNTDITKTIYANNTYSINGSTTLPTIANPVINLPSPPNVTIDNGSTLSETHALIAVSAYDAESERNEDRRNINLIKKDYVLQIEKELKILLTQ